MAPILQDSNVIVAVVFAAVVSVAFAMFIRSKIAHTRRRLTIGVLMFLGLYIAVHAMLRHMHGGDGHPADGSSADGFSWLQETVAGVLMVIAAVFGYFALRNRKKRQGAGGEAYRK